MKPTRFTFAFIDIFIPLLSIVKGGPSLATNEVGTEGCTSTREFDCYLGSSECVPSSSRCDCKFDCQFGEDEEACDDVNITSVCDGLPDCTSGADELPALCPELTTTTQRPYFSQCSPEEFECSSGQCIPSIYRCDEFRHCNDGTDEGPTCERSCSNNNGNCPQICIFGADGPFCDCDAGYSSHDNGSTCTDVDECQQQLSLTVPGCSQFCNNTRGSYQCSCTSGYKLEADGHVCKAIDRSAGNLMIATDHSIEFISNYRHLARSNELIQDIAYHFKKSTLYWITVDAVYRQSNLKSKSLIYRMPSGVNSTGLVLDRITGNLYVSAIISGEGGEMRSIIKVISNAEDEKEISTVNIVSTSTSITDLAIDSSAGFLFWSENLQPHHSYGRIIRSAPDGTSIQWLYKVTKVGHIVALVADSIQRRIYWADSSLQSIASCDYNGHWQKLAVSSTDGQPLSITLFENRISWTNSEENIIRSREVGSDTTLTQVLPEKINHILAVHPVLEEPQLTNPCSSAPCNNAICLLKDNSHFTCRPLNDDDSSFAISHLLSITPFHTFLFVILGLILT